MRAVLLGSAAGGGVPQWNCGCPVCELARRADARVSARTEFSLAVSADGARWVLIGAPLQLGAQILGAPFLEPTGLRESPIAAVVLLGAEIDQIGGLLALRERHPFALYATHSILAAIEANPIFKALDATVVARRVLEPGSPADIGGLTLELVALHGKRALWEDEEGHSATSYGVEIAARGKRLLCVPNVLTPDAALIERMRTADVVLYDGTCFTDDELAARGIAPRTARRMGHQPIAGEGGSLALLAPLSPRRLVYVHLNNTNPILIAGSPEAEHIARAGFEIGRDGMELFA